MRKPSGSMAKPEILHSVMKRSFLFMAQVMLKVVSLYQGAFVSVVRAPLSFLVAVVVAIATNSASTQRLKGHICYPTYH